MVASNGRRKEGGQRDGREARSRALAVLSDEIANLRIDDFAIAPAAEDAVVTGAFGRQMAALRRGKTAAQVLRRLRLTHSGDVVQLAFDREQGRSGDGRRIDRVPGDDHFSERQRV